MPSVNKFSVMLIILATIIIQPTMALAASGIILNIDQPNRTDTKMLTQAGGSSSAQSPYTEPDADPDDYYLINKQTNPKRSVTKKNKKQLYDEGVEAVRAKENEHAYNIWKPLANGGYVKAQLSLASMLYREGRGDKKDFPEAFELYKKAAEAGAPQAQMMLGLMYKRGAGVQKNYDEAIGWLHIADNGGNRYAPFHLAKIYEKGVYVAKDINLAKQLYKRSGERGYSWGKKAYDRLEAQ